MGTARQMTLPPDRAFCRSMPRQQQSCGHSTTGSAVCASVIRGLWSGGAKYSTVADGPVYCRWRHSFRLETHHVRVLCQWMAGGKEFGARGERTHVQCHSSSPAKICVPQIIGFESPVLVRCAPKARNQYLSIGMPFVDVSFLHKWQRNVAIAIAIETPPGENSLPASPDSFQRLSKLK